MDRITRLAGEVVPLPSSDVPRCSQSNSKPSHFPGPTHREHSTTARPYVDFFLIEEKHLDLNLKYAREKNQRKNPEGRTAPRKTQKNRAEGGGGGLLLPGPYLT